MQNYDHSEYKTDPGMLPQSRALEACRADKQGVARNGDTQSAGCDHCRGERSGRKATNRHGREGPRASEARCGVSRVFVLSLEGKALMPTHPARARTLLKKGRARVVKVAPFTIRLVDRRLSDSEVQPVAIKVDPGSKATGVAIVRQDTDRREQVLHLAELEHRGDVIRKKMQQRANYRRRRRSKNLRYRAPRFLNRKRREGWLAPSVQARADQAVAWVNRYSNLVPVSEVHIEQVRFDMQLMQNPEVSGVDYQQGTLAGYEAREYLLEKWGRKCAYCDATHVPLEVEHIVPKARGGSNRVSNLTLACRKCNQGKGDMPVEEYVTDNSRLARILKHAKAPLRDAAAVNATRYAIVRAIKTLPGIDPKAVHCWSGGRTKFNRTSMGIPKTHSLDAACVGDLHTLSGWDMPVLIIGCSGRGSYQRTRVTRHGFARGYLMRQKSVHGFRTGDLVRASVPKGCHKGTWTGRVAVRVTGSFNLQLSQGARQGISFKHCRVLQRADGYAYQIKPTIVAPPRPEGRGFRA